MEKGSKVSWSIGHTTNLGNFESLRLDVSVDDFVREGETIAEASERVYRFVEKELIKKVVEARKELDK